MSELALFDLGKGLIIDEMHGGYLGVAKMILLNWKKRLSPEEVYFT